MKLGNDEIRYMRALESITGVSARDCVISKSKLVFLVNAQDLGKAIGKNGRTVKRLSERMGKNVELMEYSTDAGAFVKKALGSIKVQNAELSNGEKNLLFLSLDSENRKKALNNIGRLKRLKEIVKREYDIDDIRIK